MTNKKSHIYTLPSGSEIEIETLPDPNEATSEVTRSIKKDQLSLEKIIEPLGEVSNLLFEKIKSGVHSPNSITLEFSASLKGQAKLVIVSGESQANIKVSLTWTPSMSAEK